MSAIIYEKTPGALVAQANRTVATFTTGLCRVDQTFICTSSAAETHRATLAVGNDFPGDSAPSTVTLKIFPDAQEIRRGDGFTEFRVSGYGSTTEDGRNISYYNKYYTHDFIADVSDVTSPLFAAGDLLIGFVLQDIRGEIVGNLWNGSSINLEIPLEELDLVQLTVSSGWTVESLTNNFTATDSEGSFQAVLRWSQNQSDGTPKRVRLTAYISRVSWTVESARNYGEIGEYIVTGTRTLTPLTELNLEDVV